MKTHLTVLACAAWATAALSYASTASAVAVTQQTGNYASCSSYNRAELHDYCYYALSHLRGVVDGLRWWRTEAHKPNWRQFGELRMWLEARLRERESRRTFTVLNTHLSVEPSLKRRQARAIVERTLAARRHGPVVLAGDLNVPASGAKGRDVEIAATLARLTDMGSPAANGRPNIDYVLADGFTPLSSRRWTGDSLSLPGSPNAETVSDHYAEDALLCFEATR